MEYWVAEAKGVLIYNRVYVDILFAAYWDESILWVNWPVKLRVGAFGLGKVAFPVLKW